MTPDDGYQLRPGTLRYLPEGGTVGVAIDEETRSFEMPDCPVTVTAEFEQVEQLENPFEDVSEGAYYATISRRGFM